MVSCKLNFTQDERLKLTEIRVFGMMCQIMLKDGHVLETQARIASRLDMKVSNLSLAVKHLKSLDYLYASTYKGRKVLRVNPSFCSKRSAAQWKG